MRQNAVQKGRDAMGFKDAENGCSRRRFLAGSAAALGSMVLAPQAVPAEEKGTRRVTGVGVCGLGRGMGMIGGALAGLVWKAFLLNMS
jgi:hypothetical protein